MAARVEKAQQGKKLADCTDNEIHSTLAKIYAMIGLHPDYYPQQELKKLLVNYMRSEMRDLSLADIGNAFTYGIQGKLYDKDRRGNLIPLDMQHFHNFNLMYLEKVIRAYREYIKPIRMKLQDKQRLSPTPKSQGSRDDAIEAQVQHYRDFLNKKAMLDAGGVKFRRLREAGLIHLTDEQINEKAKVTKSKQSDDTLQGFINKLHTKDNDPFTSNKVQVKLDTLKAFYQDLREQDISPEDYKEMLNDKM